MSIAQCFLFMHLPSIPSPLPFAYAYVPLYLYRLTDYQKAYRKWQQNVADGVPGAELVLGLE